MKKIFRTLAIVAVAALGLTACENDINEQISENDKVSVKVVGTVADLTRSTFGEINTTDKKVPSTWSGNETVGFSVNGAAWVDATNAVEGSNAEFDVELTAANEGYIYAASPRNTTKDFDLGGVTSVSGGVACYLTIPAEQTPLTGSVDESTHLLFGKHAIDGSIPETVQMAFNHIAAYGKMHIKEYQGNGIKSVTITAESDDLAAMSLKYVFADGSFDKTGGSYEAYKTITIDATNVVYTEADGGDVWFTCLPGVSDNMAGNMTIVITDNNDDTYTKPLATAGKLGFIQGQVSAFTVSMKDVTAFEPTKLETPVVSATAVENVVTVTLSEAVENAEFYTITINEDEFTTEELTYVYNGAYDTEYQISVIANTTNPLFANSDVATVSVRTPEDLSDSIIFAEEGIENGAAVESAAGANFVVTFDKGSNSNNAPKYYTSGEALRAYGGNTFTVAKTGEKSIGKIVLVYGESDGSNEITTNVPTFETNTWTGVANRVTFTISGTSGQRRIAAIRVYYTDEVAVEALATPVVTTAKAEGNVVTLSWAEVANAASYDITYGETTVNTTELTKSFELEYSTTYEFSIVAKPAADSQIYLNSEAATVSVTTEVDLSNLQEGVFYKVTSAPEDWSGVYLVVYETGNVALNGGLETIDATNNTIGVTIANGAITLNDDLVNSVVTIAKNGDAYTVKSASGYYIGGVSESNKINQNKDTALLNTLELNADGSVNVVSNGTYLRYNKTAGQYRFRYYKSSSASDMEAIHLYKLNGELPAPKIVLDKPVVTATATGTTINVSWEAVEGAKDYTVTFNGGESTQTATTAQFTDLAYNTNYTVSVVANPLNEETHKASEAGEAVVKTEADPNAEPTPEPTTPKSVTYTVTSTSEVSVSGSVPTGATKTYTSTYNTKCQLTAGNSMTLTLSGFDGTKITGLTLSMRSNSSKGAGSLSVKVGETQVAAIADSKFNTTAWYGAWSTSYVDVTPDVTATMVGEDEKIVITISATTNSLYCQSFTIDYLQ